MYTHYNHHISMDFTREGLCHLPKFTTLEKMKEEVLILNDYISILEHYKPTTTEQHILLEYSRTNSMEKVVYHINDNQLAPEPITIEHVRKLLLSKPIDPLHRILRAKYKAKLPKKRPTTSFWSIY